MTKTRHRCVMLATLVALVVPGTCFGQVWKNTPFDTNTWRLPAPPPPSVSHFGDPEITQFTLVNRTNLNIAYANNGTLKPRLAPNRSASWQFQGNTENYPQMSVSFDNGR